MAESGERKRDWRGMTVLEAVVVLLIVSSLGAGIGWLGLQARSALEDRGAEGRLADAEAFVQRAAIGGEQAGRYPAFCNDGTNGDNGNCVVPPADIVVQVGQVPAEPPGDAAADVVVLRQEADADDVVLLATWLSDGDCRWLQLNLDAENGTGTGADEPSRCTPQPSG